MSTSGSKTVKVYDFATKSVTTIPQVELAPGMVEAVIEEFGEKLWIDPSQTRKAHYRHPVFDAKKRNQLRKLVSLLGDVYPQTVEQWEDGFRRDTHPDTEIVGWLRLAAIYKEICGATRLKLSQKGELFKILVQCSVSPYESIRTVIAPESLSHATVTRAIEAYYGEPTLREEAARKPAIEYPDTAGNTPMTVELLRTPEGRAAITDVDVILGVDSFSGETKVFFGREALKNIQKSNKATMLKTASFLFDSRTDQRALLVDAVRAVKGRCCYPVEE